MHLCALVVTAAVLASCASPVATPTDAGGPCAPASGLQFICGLPAPEDLVQVPGTSWIIVSSFAGIDPTKPATGGLALIDTATRTTSTVSIDAASVARAPYDACSAPPRAALFSSHGLNIRAEAAGLSTLFVVGHGDREAIEVFKVDASTKKPSLSWIGCIPAVKGAFNNSVVALPDGRVLITDFLHAPATFADLYANRKTGAVEQWTPGGGFKKLPGTDMSGANGIEVSADLRHVFVADSGSAKVLRYELAATDKPPLVIDPGFRVDNLRWSGDGQLLLAGANPGPGCAPADRQCPRLLIAKALDPNSLALTPLLEVRAMPGFTNLSSALIVGGVLWLGSPEGDRVAHQRLPATAAR